MRLRPLLLALLPTLACAADPATSRPIIFGADFEMNRPAASHDLFFECGLNCVRLTGGGYGWAAGPHQKWATQLAAHDVQVYLQLGSHYPSADYFPLKDAWLVDQDGATGVEDRKSWAIRYDHSCWPQYSYAYQPFRAKLEKDFTAYLGNFPPNQQLAGVILHNEPGMHWLQNRVFDYGVPSVAAYRAWLPGIHGDIATLNQRYGTTFADFAAVEPPRKAQESAARWLDWRRFQVHQIADFMQWEADFTKRVRPDLQRTTNLDGPLNNWYHIRCADVEAYSRPMDTVGMDIYPTRWTDHAFVPYAVDQLLGVAQGRRAHVLECEVFSGRSEDWKQVAEEKRADLLRSELWTMFGHGVDGILLWGFSRGDTFSVTDGEWNARVLACRDVMAQQRMLDLGRFHRAPAQVALCVDPDAYLYAGTKSGGPLDGGSALDREFHGFHAALSAAGIATDVVELAQLPAMVARYKAIVLPAAPLSDQKTADLLRGFVEHGGTLIACAPFAARDRWAGELPLVPGDGLDGLFTGMPQAAANGLPGMRETAVGPGRTLLFDRAVGASHLAGQAARLPVELARCLGIAGIQATWRIRGDAANPHQPDVSVLTAGDDRLVAVTVQGEAGKAAVPATGVVVELPGYRPTAAFTFPATGSPAAGAGVTRSGPVPLKVTLSSDGCSLALGTISGALPVLLTNGHGPLLALELPTNAAANSSTMLTVTCHNPSANMLSGTIELVFAGQTASTQVTVAAWGAQRVTLPIAVPASGARLPVSARLQSASGTVSAIPVDLHVQ